MAGMLRVPRSRGALSGIVLVVLGALGGSSRSSGPGYTPLPSCGWGLFPALLRPLVA